MFKIISQNGNTVYGIKEFICDTENDLKQLPQCDMGSSAVILSSFKVFVKNGAQEWVEVK